MAIGRRERARQEKQDRIFAAAADLFDTHGFDRVTTQQIAERADIGAGTLFRYAASKGELFLMVYNRRFAAAVEAGSQAAQREADLTAAVCAQIEPVLTWAGDLDDAAHYQRELLFGDASEPYRAEGLAIVADLERRIAELLLTARPGTARQAHRGARSVFAVLNLLLVQPLNPLHPDDDATTELRAQVAQIVAGYLHTVPEAPAG
ncbi:TetR/AcrR family transcriptional regulator [Cellulomonas denverensis]|uniref:TetR/AcrR family transcriptional regulator n=1 Tax=Cellulomonas denverensis TaxID=264297 RepID=A0A7X6KS63_9CELL|nr:TetR/AcrR family transcriptional regulator [Cellulomonas denverensis]NKY21286.1 TetR/AcrR family transcriptional regulator [Cellulomonas denverensis]GIG24579.1 hypothetical protein Cde04nite_08230 [Cellulomonas denverensis]